MNKNIGIWREMFESHLEDPRKTCVLIILTQMACSRVENIILRSKYGGYRYKTITIVFTIFSTIKWVKSHLSSQIGSYGYIVYFSAMHNRSAEV